MKPNTHKLFLFFLIILISESKLGLIEYGGDLMQTILIFPEFIFDEIFNISIAVLITFAILAISFTLGELFSKRYELSIIMLILEETLVWTMGTFILSYLISNVLGGYWFSLCIKDAIFPLVISFFTYFILLSIKEGINNKITKRVVFFLLLIVLLIIASLEIDKCVMKLGGRGSSSINLKDLSTNCQKIVKLHNLSEIKACKEFSLLLDGNELKITSIFFGKGIDCEAGCIYAKYVAVIENGKEFTLCSDSLGKNYDFPEYYPEIIQIAERISNLNISYGKLTATETFAYKCPIMTIRKIYFVNKSFCEKIPSENYKQQCFEFYR